MEQKRFEQLVSQVADIELRPRDQPVLSDTGEHWLSQDTGGMKIRNLRMPPRKCADCDRVFEGAPTRSFSRRGGQWREHCAGCNSYRDRVTGQFESRLKSIALRPTKPLPTPAPQSPRTEPETTFCVHQQVIERDCHESLIREYVSHPVEIQLFPNVFLEPDSEVRKD